VLPTFDHGAVYYGMESIFGQAAIWQSLVCFSYGHGWLDAGVRVGSASAQQREYAGALRLELSARILIRPALVPILINFVDFTLKYAQLFMDHARGCVVGEDVKSVDDAHRHSNIGGGQTLKPKTEARLKVAVGSHACPRLPAKYSISVYLVLNTAFSRMANTRDQKVVNPKMSALRQRSAKVRVIGKA